MGWQLVPVGIGWRSFDKTLEEGRFSCANPRCKGRVEVTQPYRLRRSRNWFTVLFIPIIPLNMKGVYVECRSCKSIFHAAVLRDSPSEPTARPASSPAEVFGGGPAAAPSSPAEAFGRQTPSISRKESAVAPLPPLPPLPPADQPAPPPSVWLELSSGRRVDLLQPTVVGRSPSAAAVTGALLCAVDDPSMTASKTHAVFHLQSGSLRVRDLGAANGTTVVAADGSERRLRNDDTEVLPGTTVRLGAAEVRVVGGVDG